MTDDIYKRFFKSKKGKSILKEYDVPITLGLLAVKASKNARKEREKKQILQTLKNFSRRRENKFDKEQSFIICVILRARSLIVAILKIVIYFGFVLFLFYLFEHLK